MLLIVSIFFKPIFEKLKSDLNIWLNVTKDPWICSPHGVLEDKGAYGSNPSCLPLYNSDHLTLNEL